MKRRAFVTLSYTQSLDGSIASPSRKRLKPSCPESLVFNRRLRSEHDALLIGIGTVLADNPLLDVAGADGRDPVPLVVDTRLDMPASAALLKGRGIRPLIACCHRVPAVRRKNLERLGARILRLPLDRRGRLDLAFLLRELPGLDIRKVLVQGGAGIITGFLNRKLADRVIVTIAPVLAGGLRAYDNDKGAALIRLKDIWIQHIGRDIVVQGHPVWKE